MSKIIVITGPTGVGKTDLSIKLAKEIDAEIINADSMQVYQGMDVGTNKVTKSEMDGVVHHLLDIKTVDEDYSVAEYQRDGRDLIKDILGRDKMVIIVGGTGLYINALLYDYKFEDEQDTEVVTKEEMIQFLEENEIEVDKSNLRRIERAYTRFINDNVTKNGDKLLFDAIFFGVTTKRDDLYNRINSRVDEMIEEGLIEEVKALYNKYPKARSLNTAIGYKEVISYLNDEIDLNECKELIKKNTRNYAKRQYTWFNNKMDLTWLDKDEALNIIDIIKKHR